MTLDMRLVAGDCLEVLPTIATDAVDLVMTSPPYEDRRTYGIGCARKGEAWVAWMVEVVRELSRVCTGLVAIVCQGKTERYRWSATPMLLAADLARAGYNLRNPCLFHRVGIPGSGGPDWLRGDTEFILCLTRPGKLPWSDNTVMGHPPKWAPGGEMSHRLPEGQRRNQWGGKPKGVGARRQNGERQTKARPSHKIATVRDTKKVMAGYKNGDTDFSGTYRPPVLANPGNVIKAVVGGNVMGDPLCHRNEAPYPESLCEFFIRSFCAPGGLVLDPFCGSGTTLAVAKKWGRRALGIDIRPEQIAVAQERLERVTPFFPSFT